VEPLGLWKISQILSHKAQIREAYRKSEIFVQAYSFTSAPITKALVNAGKRGGTLRLFSIKASIPKYSSADLVAHAGILVYIDFKGEQVHGGQIYSEF
jgi:hypothetical protein